MAVVPVDVVSPVAVVAPTMVGSMDVVVNPGLVGVGVVVMTGLVVVPAPVMVALVVVAGLVGPVAGPGGADGAGERPAVVAAQPLHPHPGPGVRRVDEAAMADVDAHMAETVEEHQVTRA